MQQKYDEYFGKVTALILFYDQEEFVEECVLSVLNQNCPPIDIVLSDDASPDNSFEIIETCVKNYKGPHNVSLYRNTENMGVIRHFNTRVQELARPLIIPLGGDDVWELDRVRETVHFWVDNDFPTAISVNPMMIDSTGNQLRHWQESPPDSITINGLLGLEPAGRFFGGMHMDILNIFGPLSESVRNEDSQIFFRAALLSGGKALHKHVQYYRQHDANLSFDSQMIGATSEEWFNIHTAQLTNVSKMNLLWIRDAKVAFEAGHITTQVRDEIENILTSKNRTIDEIRKNLSGEKNYLRTTRLLTKKMNRPRESLRILASAVSNKLYTLLLKKRYTRVL